MRLTYNAQKFMAAIAAIAMFCFGPAMARETGLEKVYQACPGNKFAGDEIGKDKSKCYEKVTIYDVRVACLTLKKAGDGVSPVYKNALLTSKYNDVTASKDRCYNVSNGSFYSSSQSGDDPSTSESATCRDGFTKQTSGTFYKSETDYVTAKSDRPYCTYPTSDYFYRESGDRPYIDYNGCYAIGSASQLYGFADAVNNMTEGEICGTLTKDIVVNTGVLDKNGALKSGDFTSWTPMNVKRGVKVTLNGASKTISGLYLNTEGWLNAGLFCEVKGTVSISELGIKDSYIKGDNMIGGLVGYSDIGGTLSVTNSYNSGTVSGSENGVGGLVGYNAGKLTITNSYNSGTVSGGGNYVGGLVGGNVGGNAKLTITNSYNSGTVSDSGNYVGGLVGGGNANLASFTITNSYNSGTVTGENAVGGLLGNCYGKLTITNSFFLATGESGDWLGGEAKALDDFYNGTVAFLLHNWCEKDGDNCKEGGLDGSVWGQDFTKENSLPDLSGKFVGGTPHTLTLHTFTDDTRKLPTIYLEGLGLELPTDLTRENHIFLGWSAKETPGSSADIVTSIAKGETGTKTFYAQWMKVNEKGCYEIGTAFELYGFANVVNNATDRSKVCGTLVDNIVVNTDVLNDGTLNGNGSSFTPWTPMNVKSGVQVTLNGNGKTISGLYFNNENNNYVGLFGESKGTVSISDLGVKDSYFRGGWHVGGLVGRNEGGSLSIENSYNAGPVSGSGNNVGGLVGISSGELSITNSYNSGTVSGNSEVGGLVGYSSGTLTITNSFFLATDKSGDGLGGEAKALDDFYNGTVAFLLHNWCEMDGDNCKEGGLDGSVWGQDFTKENSLPDLSGKFVGGTPHTLTLHTFEGDTSKLPIIYLEGSGLKLPTDLTRKNYVFWGWSAKETAGSSADIVTSIAKDATGAKEFYAQWMKVNEKGCYEIASGIGLYTFAGYVNIATDGSKVCGMLVNNIVVNTDVLNDGTLNGDVSGFTPWTPIKVTSGKKVTLNGNGKTISGLYFNDGNQDNVGLFGDVTGALSISDLGVKDSYFKGGSYVGGLVGSNSGELTITNSYNSGTVSGGSYVGGLVGSNSGELTITNSYNSGTVSGDNYVGGLVGSNSGELTIENSYNAGTVSGSGNCIGGLVGVGLGTLTITSSYNAGAVSGAGGVGGLVGYNGGENAKLTITNSYNAGTVSGSNEVGGLVGQSYNGTRTITNSYNSGTVSGTYLKVGGLVGYNAEGTLTITNSFFLATGKSGDDLGGKAKSVDEFRNGSVALSLHDWCEMDGDECKDGGLNGLIWGQNVLNGDLLPNFSREINAVTQELVLRTFEGDTRKYPTKYIAGLELPTGMTRKGYVFLGWSSKVVAESFSDIVTSIASDATGKKEFYAQWKEFDANGCFAIASAIELYAFANVVNNATEGEICGTLVDNIVVNTGVLNNDGALNGNGSNFTPWNPMKVVSGVQVTLNGNGKTISGLYFNNENTDNVGLFGESKGTVSISDLGVKDSYFEGRENVGGLVGKNNKSATLTITNSYNAGTVSGTDDNVGGLVGYAYGTLTITNSYNVGTVSGNSEVGGLVGLNYEGKLTITNSYNAGTVSSSYGDVGGLVGYVYDGTLTITNNSFFLAAEGVSGEFGGEVKALEEFHNGTVALLLHDWCEMDGDNCKVGGLDGSIWGQDVLNGDVLPNFSGKINVETYELVLNTFEGDTRKYPTEYLSVTGLELPMALERENHIFLGWSSKEVAESFSDIVTSIAKNETGAKTFYAQWKELNADGCFEISSTFDLYAFANVVNNATNGSQVCGTLVDNIVVNTGVLNTNGALNGDCSNFTPWTLVNVQSGVQVTLNGNGKTISGLYFNDGNTDKVGLFGDVNGALSISDLGVKDSYFEGHDNVGGFVGDNVGSLTITNSYNEGTVSGREKVGGLVGYNNGGTLTITNSYNSGTVSGSNVGGLVGYNSGKDAKLTITNSYNSGTVSGDCFVGGLVGDNYGGTLTITSSYNAGTVNGNFEVGGLVGENCSILTITNSYNAGTVSGCYGDVGGVVGANYDGTVSNVYNTGSVSGNDVGVGGVVGVNYGTVSNAYNTGSVSGSGDNVGGVVGSNYDGTVSNVYNTGSVSGSGDNVGGVVGNNYDTVSNGFFNTEVTCKNCKVVEGTTGMSSGKFADGTVALLLRNWCEKEDGSDECKVDGLNGSIWGQDVMKDYSLPNFSDSVLSFKRGGVAFFYGEGNEVDSAYVDAASESSVKFEDNVVVNGPTVFKRTFSSSGYSTIMLPFTPNCEKGDCIEGVKFFEFNSYTDGEVQATEVSPKDLKANTPYLVQVAGASEIVFKNGGTFNTTTGDAYNPETGIYKVALTGDGAGWTIYGTYTYKKWLEDDKGLGKTYGFAANDGVNDESIVGKFAKIAAGAYIYPMRAYLEYDAPVALARPAANGEVRTLASLPETINVVIVDKDETSGEQTTRVIGTINTRTGEIKFATDRWFDLQGRYLGVKKPTQKGAYYNNGKKVIVK